MFAAAGKTCDCAADAADSRKLLTTIRTAIDEPRGVRSRRKRQSVTALLVGDFQVQAGLPPFGTVRWNPPTASAKLGENVGKFMAQCSIDFGWMLD
jgi:hypothetical protein